MCLVLYLFIILGERTLENLHDCPYIIDCRCRNTYTTVFCIKCIADVDWYSVLSLADVRTWIRLVLYHCRRNEALHHNVEAQIKIIKRRHPMVQIYHLCRGGSGVVTTDIARSTHALCKGGFVELKFAPHSSEIIPDNAISLFRICLQFPADSIFCRFVKTVVRFRDAGVNGFVSRVFWKTFWVTALCACRYFSSRRVVMIAWLIVFEDLASKIKRSSLELPGRTRMYRNRKRRWSCTSSSITNKQWTFHISQVFWRHPGVPLINLRDNDISCSFIVIYSKTVTNSQRKEHNCPKEPDPLVNS